MNVANLPSLLANAKNAFMLDLAEIPQVKRGLVYCLSCGATQSIGVNNFSSGWPKCCGQTMSLDSPEERAAHIATDREAKNGG